MPSSRQMTRAVPTRPLYNLWWFWPAAADAADATLAEVAEDDVPATAAAAACCCRCRAANPPCACSFVLMTSSGHVTTPAVKPPTAPARALNCDSDARSVQRSNIDSARRFAA